MKNRALFLLIALFIIPYGTLLSMEGQHSQSSSEQKVLSEQVSTPKTVQTFSSSTSKKELDLPEKDNSTFSYLTSFITREKDSDDVITFLELMQPHQTIADTLTNQAKVLLYIDRITKESNSSKVQKFITLSQEKVDGKCRITLDEKAKKSLKNFMDTDVQASEELLYKNMQKKFKAFLASYKEDFAHCKKLRDIRKLTLGNNSNSEEERSKYPKPETLESCLASLNLFTPKIDEITQPDLQQQQKQTQA